MQFLPHHSATHCCHIFERVQLPLRYLKSLIQTRTKTTIFVLAILVIAITGAGCYGYAFHEWHAAQRALKNYEPANARKHLDVCLFFWPASADVRLFSARAARLSGEFERAESLLRDCLKLQGGATAAVQLEFLLLRCQAGEVDDVAAPLLELVEDHHPESAQILETLARAYMHNLNFGPAYACLSRWIETAPDVARAYHYRGWVTERLDNPKEAMANYERALQLNPDLFAVRLRIVEMFLEDTKPLEALPHLEYLSRQFPDRADVKARLGHCYLVQGKNAEARPLLEAAVKELPDEPPVLLNLAKLDLQDDHPVQAEAWLRQAIKLDAADTEALYVLATALQYQGRKQEAAATLELHQKKAALLARANRLLKEEARHPNNSADLPFELGSLFLQLGDERKGVQWLNQAIVRDPTHQPAHKLLAEYYESKGEKDKAAAYRKRLPK
jgi:Tfp pilus assembly protein PilF